MKNWLPKSLRIVSGLIISILARTIKWLAGRNGPIISRRNFDSEWYVETNCDVAESDLDPFYHFIHHGAREGRQARFFDAFSYRKRYADIQNSPFDAWTHYQRCGRQEGRQAWFFYVNALAAGGEKPGSFSDWLASYGMLDAKSEHMMREIIKHLALTQTIQIVLTVDAKDNVSRIKRSISAIRKQIYPNLSLIVGLASNASDAIINAVKEAVGSDTRIRLMELDANIGQSAIFNRLAIETEHGHLCFLRTTDVLDPAALFWVALTLKECPDSQLIYSDEDRIDADGLRSRPYFKPDINYELFLSHNMLGAFVVYDKSFFEQIGGFDEAGPADGNYDLGFRAYDAGAVIRHIPRLLNHIDASAETELDAEVVRRHLYRKGIPGKVLRHVEAEGYNRVRFACPDPLPLVSIIIPTRDRVELLRMAVASVLEKTTYTRFELIIVDNGSIEPATLTYFNTLKDDRIRIIHDNRPFNFSALNNNAVNKARGDYICLMNNDIEVITPDWLEEMMSFAAQPGVGCVGARLWYPDGTLQHAGVLVGFHGVAGHMHKFLPRGDTGYANRAVVHQTLSAVTGAVLLVKKSIYEAVGGMDENLAVAFNDVDLCLKARDAGFRNVYTPFAEMTHHESASRGAEDTPEKKAREKFEIEIIKARYGNSLMQDPAYNPNLTLLREDLSLAFPPRLRTMAELERISRL